MRLLIFASGSGTNAENIIKYFEQNDQLLMPLSIEVHHSFVDGFHIGQYFEILQKEINQLLNL